MSSARSELTADPVVLVAGKTLPVVIRRYPKAKGYRLRYDATRGELRLSLIRSSRRQLGAASPRYALPVSPRKSSTSPRTPARSAPAWSSTSPAMSSRW